MGRRGCLRHMMLYFHCKPLKAFLNQPHTFESHKLCTSLFAFKKLINLQLFENLNDAYVISMSMFATCKLS